MSAKQRNLSLLIILVLAATSLLLTTASSDSVDLGQSAASITVSPGQGPPGTHATVIGSGFPGQHDGRILWDLSSGALIGTFTTNANGAFSTSIEFPSSAAPGGHVVWACTIPKRLLAGPVCASKGVKVTATASKTPTRTPTRAAPTTQAVTILPMTAVLQTPGRTACDVRGIAGEVVIDFEAFAEGQNLRGVTLPEGVRFIGDIDLRAFSPSVATHSGTKALRTDYAGEFGSAGAMMRIGFTNVQDFVGMYVGLNEKIWATSPMTAVLTAYGLDGSSLGTDSVSFGPEATPIRKCLSVSAPGIVEVTLNYMGAAEPEVIDDLTLRGPATPVPVPGDDRPPVVTILMPEEGAQFTRTSVRLQGEVREDRELAGLRYSVNMGETHDLVFTPAGMTPEGEHLYLFAVDPLPAAELRTCGDNLVVVEATDISGNEAWDGHTFQMYVGDLEILDAEAVQVVYGADLVRNKATAFRVKVRSTFTCDVSTRLLLELPESDWSTLPPATGRYVPAIDLGWEYPDTWGPVIIPAGASDHTVMLPLVPEGEEGSALSSANPTGVIAGRLAGGVEGPDVRAVPRPIADEATFAVVIDPSGSLPEQNERNNRFVSPTYSVVSTRSFCFYIVPVLVGGTGPETSHLNIKEHLEFLLATFPFADSKVTWKMAPVHEMTCPHNPDEACNWALTDEGDFGAQAALDALRADCDVAIVMGHGWTGNSCVGCRGGSLVGDNMGSSVLAHEFSHSWLGVEDIYSLDCMVDWDEFYCEYGDGHREYYCQDDAVAKPSDYVGMNCYCPDPGAIDCSSDEMTCAEEAKVCEAFTGCSAFRRTEACRRVAPEELCDWVCAEQIVLSECEGQLLHARGPDCRIRHNTSEGFWVNKWLPQPAGQTYLMDCAGGSMWVRLESTEDHCEPGKVFPDGYVNALRSPDFVTGADPEALLVRGVIYRSGEVELQPFLYLPQANLDRAEGAPGDYRFVLYGESGELLSQTGIDAIFERSGVGGGPTDRMPFVLRIAWADGTRRVVVQNPDGEEVASVAVTPHAPEVELLSPNGGQTWVRGRAQSIQWQASDADGDALSYFVDISADGGENWWPIASDLTRTEYTLEIDPYAAGAEYLVRVVATDGINTTSDVSDAPFVVVDSTTSIPPWAFVLGIVATGVVGLTVLLAAFRMTAKGRRSSTHER